MYSSFGISQQLLTHISFDSVKIGAKKSALGLKEFRQLGAKRRMFMDDISIILIDLKGQTE